LKSQYAIL
jgi:hypothetical protein